MKVNCKTRKGGSVELNKKHGVWASYSVARAGTCAPAEILYAGAKLKDGRRVVFFLNRETGLVVVDVVDRSDKSGIEILRRNV
jgi:hypothetical protein